jgi:glycerophosphoryl diester phosphodiesterase
VSGRRAAAGALATLAGCAPRATTPVADCPPSPFRSSPPLVIAHSGGEGLGPANTLLAMRRSRAAGADILDVDVRMTADGVVVAIHDRDVSTTTAGTGNVDELTWPEVRALDTRASWQGEPIEDPVPIPSLEEILTEFDEGWISLEIKQSDPPMAVALCEVLRATGSTDRVYLSANDDTDVYAAQAACPEVLITTTHHDLDVMRAAAARGEPMCAPAPIGQPPYREFEAAAVAERHAAGTALFTWTVDDPDQFRRLAEVGIDGVYTRRPDIARAVFDSLDG